MSGSHEIFLGEATTESTEKQGTLESRINKEITSQQVHLLTLRNL